METIKSYYSLTKPGVTYGNAFSAVAGFLLAANGQIDLSAFVAFTVGITFVIASACVLNNYLDQDIDRLMMRTKARAIVSGKIRGRNAVMFSIVLGLIGIVLIDVFTNRLATIISIFGFVTYVLFYGMLSKRLSIHGTLVGSISGAAPILAGYVAVSGAIDIGAVLVFLVLFFWQMPEFYSIAIYRKNEYASAGVPVMPVIKGVNSTKRQIWWYTLAYVLTTVLLGLYGYTGLTYLTIVVIIGMYWLRLATEGLEPESQDTWARRMFRFSLINLVVFCLLISFEAWLP